MKKKNETKLKTLGAGLAIAIATTGIVLGCVRLFGVPQKLIGKHEMLLKELCHVELDADFFKNAKETTEQVSGADAQIFTYSIPKTDYDVIISNYAGTTDAPFDFEKSLCFNNGASKGSIKITNLKGVIIEFEGLDKNNEKVKESRNLMFTDAKPQSGINLPQSYYEYDTSNPFVDLLQITAISIYGDLDSQPKAATTI